MSGVFVKENDELVKVAGDEASAVATLTSRIGALENEVEYLNEKTYNPGGCTAMNDGIGTAIDKIGKMPAPFVKYVSTIWKIAYEDDSRTDVPE